MADLPAIPSLECVSERDIDLLLVEELSCCERFRAWFLSCFSAQPDSAFLGVWHSVCDSSLGESDLILLVKTDRGRHAYLLENKIDATVQPDQPSRYRERGEIGIARGYWEAFQTAVVAPHYYLSFKFQSEDFDFSLSYEALESFLRSEGSRRSIYKAGLLRAAIDQQRRGYQAVRDDCVTAFWNDYYLRVSSVRNGLSMRKPGGVPSDSDWITLFHDSVPRGCALLHKLADGYIDAQFPVARFDVSSINGLSDEILERAGVARVQMKRSVALRAVACPMSRKLPFEAQEGSFVAAMEATENLVRFVGSLSLQASRSSRKPL